jgi:ABC-type multidrug transport system permease subunit
MTLRALAYYTILIAPFLVQLVMLTLQVSAYRRYGHVSFLLLSVATVCGLLVLTIPLAHRWWNGNGMSIPLTWFVGAALALLVQCALTVWGTASLFRSYGALAGAVPGATPAEAPNNRWRGP